MKNLILIMAAVLLTFSSCQKEEVVLETNGVNLFDKASNNLRFFEWPDEPYGDPFCLIPGGTCIGEVIIRGEIAKAFDIIDSGNDTAIEVFFKENQKDLTESINKLAIDLVIQGNLTVESAGPNSKGETFMIFKDNAGKRKLVIPFVQ